LLGDTPKPQNQKPNQEQNQKLVAFKKLRFFQWLSVSKAQLRLCYFHQNAR
jgi:hypothetical protein